MIKLAQLEPVNYGNIENDIIGSHPSTGSLVSRTLVYIWSAAGIMLLIYLVSAGFQYMTAAGNPKQMAVARGKISNGLVGIIIVLVSYWIVQLVGEILGIEAIGQIFN